MKKTLLAVAITCGFATAAQAQTPLLGSILIFAGNFCPNGYLPTAGALLPINQYQALFSLLGTTYGGDGQSTFALPNSKPIFTQTRATYTQCIAISGVFPSRN